MIQIMNDDDDDDDYDTGDDDDYGDDDGYDNDGLPPFYKCIRPVSLLIIMMKIRCDDDKVHSQC